jgi:hypothetical protein
MGRGKIDWAACEADYRSGSLSNRQLAELYGCGESGVRDRAKRFGWQRDLSEAVRKATNAKLLRAELRSADPRSDAQIVDDGAELRAAVIRAQRVTIGRGQKAVEELFSELEEGNKNRDEIEAAILEETKGVGQAQRRGMMLRAVALPTRSTVLVNLANAAKTFTGLERQAFNIDVATDPANNPDAPTTIQFVFVDP